MEASVWRTQQLIELGEEQKRLEQNLDQTRLDIAELNANNQARHEEALEGLGEIRGNQEQLKTNLTTMEHAILAKLHGAPPINLLTQHSQKTRYSRWPQNTRIQALFTGQAPTVVTT